MKKMVLMTGVALMAAAVSFGATIASPTVVSNSAYLAELVLNSSYTVGSAVNLRQNPQASAPTKVTINSGGSLRLTDITSRVVAPLDLDIASGGKVFFPHGSSVYARSTLIAHKLKVNGTVMAKGRYQGATSGGYSSWFEAQPGSSIVVPYVWTGAGDGTSWSDAANWEGNAVPPNTDYTTAVDLSRAAGRTITVSEAIKLTCIAFLPSGAQRKVMIGGTGSLWIHAPAALNGAFVIAEDCELALDVDLKRTAQDPAAWLSMIGGGRLTVRRGYPGVTYQTSGDATTMREPFAIDGTLAFEGPAAAIQVWWSVRYNYAIFSASTMENQGHSRIEVAPDCTLTTDRVFGSCGGFYAFDEFVQKGGTVDLTKKSAKDLWLVNHNSAQRGLTYELQDGNLTASVRLGCKYHGPMRYSGGSFRMTGGTLTAIGLTSESNGNFFKLEGGRLRLGSSGIARTSTDDKDRTWGGNNVPDLLLGGVTFDIITTSAISCPLPLQFTGIGGDTVFECNNGAASGGDMTFSNGVYGEGSFVKRGANTLTFTSVCSFSGGLTVEAGKVAFSAASTVSGVSRLVVTGGSVEILSAAANVTAKPSYIGLANASSLVLGSGINLKANRLVIGGVEQMGTVTFGQGTVTVEAPAGIVWKGANGGNWSVGANWEGGSAPGAGATADLSFAEGQTINVDTAVGVAKIVCKAPGTVTLKASGGSFSFPDPGSVDIGEGTRLVLDVPVKVVEKKYFRKYGRGTLVLAGGVASATANSSAYCTAVQGVLEVQCAATDIRFFCESQDVGAGLGTVVIGEGADLSARSSAGGGWCSKSGDAMQNGGTIDMTASAKDWTDTTYFPFCAVKSDMAASAKRMTYTLNDGLLKIPNFHEASFYTPNDGFRGGDFAFVQNGGTANFRHFYLTKDATQKGRYELNGGTLQTRWGFKADVGEYGVALNGGRIEVSDTTTALFPDRKAVTLGGDVTIRAAADKTVTIPCDLAGGGSLAVEGPGTLKTTVPLSGVKSLAVKGGTLELGGETAATNLTLSAGAKLRLDFNGVQVVRRLTLNGREKGAGDYGVASGKTLGGRLTGTGTLRVLEGMDQGLTILIR